MGNQTQKDTYLQNLFPALLHCLSQKMCDIANRKVSYTEETVTFKKITKAGYQAFRNKRKKDLGL